MADLAWLLDSNALSDIIRQPAGPVARQALAQPAGSLCTSIICACELRFGAQRKGSAVLTQRVALLLDQITVLPLDGAADRHYADIRAALEAQGTPIGAHDLFIASHARAADLTLVTRNTREFTRVQGLRCVDWTLPAPSGL